MSPKKTSRRASAATAEALSNKRGALPLLPAQSELAVGYCTLYGDMSAVSRHPDVPKTMVDRARDAQRSSASPVIPRPFSPRRVGGTPAHQTDQDSLRRTTCSTTSCIANRAPRTAATYRAGFDRPPSTACFAWCVPLSSSANMRHRPECHDRAFALAGACDCCELEWGVGRWAEWSDGRRGCSFADRSGDERSATARMSPSRSATFAGVM